MRLALLVLVLAACAHPAPAEPDGRAGSEAPARRGAAFRPGPGPGPRAQPGRPGSIRQHLVAAARRHLGQAWPGDCSSFVERVYREAGLTLAPLPARSASEGLWRASRPVRRPAPGDLAFFHDTFDRDGDGRRHDRFTHVALVEAVDGPRVTLIHRSSRGIQRLALNLSRRHDPAENGWLRKRRAGDPPGLQRLAGELFAAYGAAVPPGR